MKIPKKILFSALLSTTFLCVSAKVATLQSPNGSISVSVEDSDGLRLSIDVDGASMLEPSPIGMAIEREASALKGGSGAQKIKNIKKQTGLTEVVTSPFYRQADFSTTCNKMDIGLGDGFQIEVRAYDDGVAYRFVSKLKGEYIVKGETASYQLGADRQAWLPYTTNPDKPMAMAYQNTYHHTALSHAKDLLAFLPATIDCGSYKVTLAESDLRAYPGMYVKADTTAYALDGVFAPYPAKTDYYPWRMQEYVTETTDYIARCQGPRTFPWRIFAITHDDCQMPVNNLVYALAEPSRIADTSWIKPGKVAWDWWNDWGLKGVPFEAGINMDTYRYYIDFASDHGLDYVILDEGWYDPKSGDMLTVIPELDLEELVRYADSRNVGIVLWTVFNVLDTQLEQACSRYQAMGVKGFKVDFLDRDDQTAIEMVYRICEATARHGLILDLHGIYKPTGLNRTYPNVVNFESVFGMEEMKWSQPTVDMPLYDVTFPYIRLLAGPVDYTPGAMRNASRQDWHAVYRNPVSMGTRCHQLATYIVYDSPFTMLCDSPSNYATEAECVDFIVGIPDRIDETRILAGKMGEYIVTARRSGSDWWIGGLTNWDSRDIEVDLSSLGIGKATAIMLVDGVNADEQAEDYAVEHLSEIPATLTVHMAQGGGFAMKITEKQ